MTTDYATVEAAAARSKRTDAELMRLALGDAPDNEISHAAFAMYKHRAGELATLTAADVARAAGTITALEG